MKTKLPLFVALAAAISSPGAFAQEEQPSPQPPSAFGAPPSQPASPGQPPTPPESNRPTPPPEERRDRDERPQGRRGERDRFRDNDREREGRDREGDQGRDNERARPDDRRHRGPGDSDRPGGPRSSQIGEPQPYLGIMTSPVPPALSAQLGLEEGFGLLVQEVLPNSPAATAGLQKHDVLKLLNDQKLVEPSQLATLVRAVGKDSQISLTLVRKGQEQKVSVTVGERAQPIRRRFDGPLGSVPMLNPHGGPKEAERFQERVRKFQERMQDMHKRQMSPQPRDRNNPAHVPSADILKEARPGGGAQITVFNTDGVTRLDSSKARLILKDSDGEIEVAAENGKRTLTAKNAKGEVVFSGPVNTKEERQAVPEQFQSKLEKIEVRQETDTTTGRSEWDPLESTCRHASLSIL